MAGELKFSCGQSTEKKSLMNFVNVMVKRCQWQMCVESINLGGKNGFRVICDFNWILIHISAGFNRRPN